MNLYLKSPRLKTNKWIIQIIVETALFLVIYVFKVPFRVSFFLFLRKGSFLSTAVNTDVKFYFNSVQWCMNIPRQNFRNTKTIC